MWLFYFFLLERTLKQELQVKEKSAKKYKGKFYNLALLHHQAFLHILLNHPLPLHLLLIITIFLLLLLILLLFILVQEVWKASRPSLLS